MAVSDTAVVLAQAFRLLEREARLSGDWHSSSRDLNAYRSGELSPQQERQLQWHLALCFQCADRLLDLERFLEPLANGDLLDETGSWWDLQDRLAKESRVHRRPPPIFMALAATLIPAVAGLLFWNLSLQRELSAPQANFPIESVEMPGTLRNAAPKAVEIRLPAAGRFSLSLVASEVLEASEVRLEILDSSGRPVVSVPGLRRSESDTFNVELSRRLLPNGDYRLVLIGTLEDGTESREETALRVVDF